MLLLKKEWLANRNSVVSGVAVPGGMVVVGLQLARRPPPGRGGTTHYRPQHRRPGGEPEVEDQLD